MTVRSRLVGSVLGAIASPRTTRVAAGARAAWRRLRGKAPVLELYAQVDDPNTYLTAQLLAVLHRRYPDVAIDVIPISAAELPAGARPPASERTRHLVRDARALARHYEVTFPDGPELPDPELVRRGNALLAGAERCAISSVVDIGASVWSGDELAMARLEGTMAAAPVAEVADRLARGRARLERGHYMAGAVHLDGVWAAGIDRLHYIEAVIGARDRALVPRAAAVPSPYPPPAAGTALELFHSFRSPFSYLALERAFALADARSIPIAIRPIVPAGMRGIRATLAKQLYLLRDAKREADRLGVPFDRVADPVGVAIERCHALFSWAQRAGRERPLAIAIGRALWVEARDLASDRDLSRVVADAGLDWSEAKRQLSDPTWRDQAARNLADLEALGQWGVPTFRFGDTVAWGQDRMWIVEEAISPAST